MAWSALTRPGWRLRAPPAVSDDPILWREMSTSRVGFLSWAFSQIIILGIYTALGYVTYFFGRPAFVELWYHGYTAGLTTAERPELNLMIRFFMPEYGLKPPVDIARTEFNVLLRFITAPMTFFVAVMAASTAAAGIASERAKETWNSLIATPLTAQDLLRSKMLAALWQNGKVLITMLVLWTIGLIAGSSAGIPRRGDRDGRDDLVLPGVGDARLGTSQGPGDSGRAERTARHARGFLWYRAVVASWSIELGTPGCRLGAVCEPHIAGHLPGRSRRVAFRGIPSLAMDSDRHRRGGGLGGPGLSDREIVAPGALRSLLLAVRQRELRSADRSTLASSRGGGKGERFIDRAAPPACQVVGWCRSPIDRDEAHREPRLASLLQFLPEERKGQCVHERRLLVVGLPRHGTLPRYSRRARHRVSCSRILATIFRACPGWTRSSRVDVVKSVRG